MRGVLVLWVAMACSHPGTPPTPREPTGGSAALRWNFAQPNEARFDTRDDLSFGHPVTYTIDAPPVLPDSALWMQVLLHYNRPEVPLTLEVLDAERHPLASDPGTKSTPDTLAFVRKGPLTKFYVNVRAADAKPFTEPVEFRLEVIATALPRIATSPVDPPDATPCNANNPDFTNPACCQPLATNAKVYGYDGAFAKIALGQDDGIVVKTPGMIDEVAQVYVANVLSAHESKLMVTGRDRVDAKKIAAGESTVTLSLPRECRRR
jgi:hypothetical protein